MATAHLLSDRFRVIDGLDRSVAEELYHVTGITNWTDDNTVTEVLNYVPRVLGQSHPDVANAICVDKTLYKKINPTDALVYVYFTSRTTSTRRFRSSSTRGFTGTVQAPYWTLSTGGSGTNRWVYHTQTLQREHSLRMETRYVRNGSLTDTSIGIMHNLVGAVFRFPDNINGIPYLLKSPSITDWAPGQSRLIYTFETACRMPQMPVGTVLGLDIELPALGYLEEYYSSLGGNGTPLPVSVVPVSRYYQATQSQLPFLL